jgi:hypothetical protein
MAKMTKSTTRRSTVQKLCDAIHAAAAAHGAAIKRYTDADQAADRAMPRPPKSIRPSRRP